MNNALKSFKIPVFNGGAVGKLICSPLLTQARHGHRIRGKRPGIAKSLSEKLTPWVYDKELARRHDIGFPFEKAPRSMEFKTRHEHLKKQKSDLDLEKQARSNTLEIDLEEVKKDWFQTAGPFHLRKIADHYKVYDDLFGKLAFFVPRVQLNIKYSLNDDSLCPVYCGNRIQPSQANAFPEVSFDHKFSLSYNDKPEENTLWTLALTNPDGHLTQNDKEVAHWMVGNIPNGDISKGEVIIPYLQPLPLKGTGYHRFVFVLYKQDKKLDFSEHKVTDSKDMDKRTFYTFDFYKKYQDQMTPAGLSFFQSKWDDTVLDVFHNTLDMKHPVFEYDFPKAYLKYQRQFPHREAFNLYLDRYADPKEVNKKFVMHRLAKTHPFEGPEPKLCYPNAHEIDESIPTWYRTEMRKGRLGRGRINDSE